MPPTKRSQDRSSRGVVRDFDRHPFCREWMSKAIPLVDLDEYYPKMISLSRLSEIYGILCPNFSEADS